MNESTITTIRNEIAELRAQGHTTILVSLERGTGQANWGEAMALPADTMEQEMASLNYNTEGMMTAEEFEAQYA